MSKSLLIVLFWLPLAAGCAGLDTSPRDLAPIRSTFLDDTGTAAKGGVELQAGAFIVPDSRTSVPTTLSWGAGEATELSASWFVYRWWEDPTPPEQDGIGNAQATVRHRFVDETDGAPAVLGRLDLYAPVGNAGARLFDQWGGAASVTVTKHFAGIALNANCQFTAFNDPDGSSPETVYTLGLMASGFITERWFGFGEWSGFYGTTFLCHEQFVQVGAGYLVADNLALDLSGIVGLDGENDCDDFVLSTGFTLSF